MVEGLNTEINLNITTEQKIKSLQEFVTSPEGQKDIVNFVENLKTELGSKEGWLNTCQKAQEEYKTMPVTEQTFNQLSSVFDTYVNQMPPGHDKGHYSRDLLTSIVLFDSLKNKAAFQSEAAAGLLAGTFHDIGTSVIPRYQDNKYGAGHGETGAYLFWETSDGILGENMRKLVTYSIAAHAHYTKPIEVQIPAGYQKDKYWDDTWTDENNKLNGISVQMARRADRADTNGVTQMFRHIISRMDSIEEGGRDLSDGQWVDINHDSLFQTLNPIVRDPIPNPPTTLEHMYRYARSNDGKNVYSEKDYLFSSFQEVLTLKLTQIEGLIDSMNHSTKVISDTPENFKSIHDLFYKVSKSNPQRFEKAWENFQGIWSELSPEAKSRWYNGFKYSESAYNQILDFYQNKTKTSDFVNIAKDTIKNLRSPN